MSNIAANNFHGFKPELHAAGQSATETLKDIEKTSTSREELGSKNSTLPRNDSAQVIGKEVTVNSDALEKLFEMFELVFKAMRSLLSGRGFNAKLPVDTASVLPTGDAQVRASTGGSVQIVAKGKSTEATPTADKEAQVKLGTDGSIEVSMNGKRTEATPPKAGKGTQADLGAGLRVKAGGKDKVIDSPQPSAGKDTQVNLGGSGSVSVEAGGKDKVTVSPQPSAGKDTQANLGGSVSVEAGGTDKVTVSPQPSAGKDTQANLGGSVSVEAGGKDKVTDSPQPGAGTASQVSIGSEGDAKVTVLSDGSTQVSLAPDNGRRFNINLAAGVQVRVSSEDVSGPRPLRNPQLNTDAVKVGSAANTATTIPSKLETQPSADATPSVQASAQVTAAAAPLVEVKAGGKTDESVKAVIEPKVEIQTADTSKLASGMTSQASGAGRPIHHRPDAFRRAL
jgi:hypothetical protein